MRKCHTVRFIAPGLREHRCSSKERCAHPEGPWLPPSEFYPDSTSPYGIGRQCKSCRRRTWRIKYQNMSDDQKRARSERSKHWLKQHPLRPEQREYRKLYMRKYRACKRKGNESPAAKRRRKGFEDILRKHGLLSTRYHSRQALPDNKEKK